MVVMEMLADGTTSGTVNSPGVEVRNSLAKLLLTVEDCQGMNVTYGDLTLGEGQPHLVIIFVELGYFQATLKV